MQTNLRVESSGEETETRRRSHAQSVAGRAQGAADERKNDMELMNENMNTTIVAIIPISQTPDPRGKGDPHGDRRRSILRKRINRVLAKCGKKLVLTRFASDRETLGDAYIFNYDSFSVIEHHVDIEAYAKTIGCADPEAYIPTV